MNSQTNRPPQLKWVKQPKTKKSMKTRGKRTLKREAMNRRLKKQNEALGITKCEIRIPGKCLDSIMLSWAHSRKSRFLITDEHWMHAALCCLSCHEIIEAKSHEEMFTIVSEAINRRTLA